jgi:hypothetical protein
LEHFSTKELVKSHYYTLFCSELVENNELERAFDLSENILISSERCKSLLKIVLGWLKENNIEKAIEITKLIGIINSQGSAFSKAYSNIVGFLVKQSELIKALQLWGNIQHDCKPLCHIIEKAVVEEYNTLNKSDIDSALDEALNYRKQHLYNLSFDERSSSDALCLALILADRLPESLELLSTLDRFAYHGKKDHELHFMIRKLLRIEKFTQALHLVSNINDSEKKDKAYLNICRNYLRCGLVAKAENILPSIESQKIQKIAGIDVDNYKNKTFKFTISI